MPQIFTFNGVTRRILLGNTDPFSAQELYSRWKDWVQQSDNSKYEIALRTVSGDPISTGQSLAPSFFLNTPDGWRIQPFGTSHTLKVEGNLYSDDPDIDMYVVPIVVGQDVAVAVLGDRSQNALVVSGGGGGGVDETIIRNAMTAQGYTTARAPKIDFLDAAVSTRAQPGQGLTSGQATSLSTIEGRVDVATSSREPSGAAAGALAAIGLDGPTVDHIDANISSRATPGQGLTSGQATTLATAATDAEAAAAASTAAYSAAQAAVAAAGAAEAAALAAPAAAADAVLDEALAGHTGAGSVGQALGRLDATVSSRATPGQGLTPEQATELAVAAAAGLSPQQETMLLEMWRILGLDPDKPLSAYIHPTTNIGYKRVADGSEINQTVTRVGTLTTITRTP